MLLLTSTCPWNCSHTVLSVIKLLTVYFTQTNTCSNLQDCFISKHRTCYVSELRQKVSNILCKHSRVHLFLIHGGRLETSDYSILYVVNVKQALHNLLLVEGLNFYQKFIYFFKFIILFFSKRPISWSIGIVFTRKFCNSTKNVFLNNMDLTTSVTQAFY